MIRHIVFRILGRSASLGVSIDTEHAEVARLTGPHPVVCLTTKLTHRLRYGEYQTDVVVVAIGGLVVFVAFVERFYLYTQRGVLFLDCLLPGILQTVDNPSLLVEGDALQFLHHLVGHVFLLHHKADKETLVRQLFLKTLGIESIQQIVMLYGRVTTNSIKAAVVVGEYKTIGRYHDTRAKTTEVDYGILDGIVTLIELFWRQLESILLHLLDNGRRQIVECPHALISMSSQGAQTHQR